MGFGWLISDDYAEVFFPHWFLALLFAILPGCWLIGALSLAPGSREGLCPK